MENAAALPFALRHVWIVLALPLLSFVLNGLWTCRKKESWSGPVSTVLAGANWIFGTLCVWQWWKASAGLPGRSMVPWSFDWLTFGQLGTFRPLTAGIGALLDPISAMMVFVVATIAFFVHVYSIGYMREDPARGRFFPLLSLFAFAMLGLVLATNVFQMYVFWELVGVSSYQLIGFWYHKPSAVAASKKAFIVTRFADAFFLLGIVVLAWVVRSFDFSVLNSAAAAEALLRPVSFGLFEAPALPVAAALVFAGGWGKSAMFPLHIWLPDAMEGPTPVSSIIHSATMVVAGVFLSARMFPLFSAVPSVMGLIAFVGAFTAAFAAVVAITQQDIKRILAFSTLSQIGYMLFALGAAAVCGGGVLVAGYSASMFHVFTHAFFKCLLFLVAGSVIHVAGNNMLSCMGGLRTKMPLTYLSALAATLAISGIPPFSGFWSKDEIVASAFQAGHPVLGTVGLLVGALTAFYMFRFFFLIFHGEARSDRSHAHEDRWMTFPIVCLAIPSLCAGILAKPLFESAFRPALLPGIEAVEGTHAAFVPVAATLLALAGAVAAWFLSCGPKADVARALDAEHRPARYRLVYRKFCIDEIWLFVVRRILFERVAAPIKWFDRKIVDGAMNLVGKSVVLAGWCVNALQNGSLATALAFAAGGFILVWLLAGNLFP